MAGRGGRRGGVAGNLGKLLGVALLLGGLLLAGGATWEWRRARAAQAWPEVRAVVVRARAAGAADAPVVDLAVRVAGESEPRRVDLVFGRLVGPRGVLEALAAYPVGRVVQVRRDPADPAGLVVEAGEPGADLAALGGLGILLGLLGVGLVRVAGRPRRAAPATGEPAAP